MILFKVLWFKWSAIKHCVAKFSLATLEVYLFENDCNYDS